MFGRLTPWQRLRRLVEDVLVGCGFAEAYTPSFVADGDLRLPEPLSAEAAALRTVLYASLLEPARRNADAGEEAVALFEIARVYARARRRGARRSAERAHWHVAGIVDGGFAEAKWAVEQIYAALKIEPSFERTARAVSPSRQGRAGRRKAGSASCTRRCSKATGERSSSISTRSRGAAPQVAAFEEVSPYPEVRQDLAFVVDEEVPAAELLAAIREAAGELLRELAVFDEYRGADSSARESGRSRSGSPSARSSGR